MWTVHRGVCQLVTRCEGREMRKIDTLMLSWDTNVGTPDSNPDPAWQARRTAWTRTATEPLIEAIVEIISTQGDRFGPAMVNTLSTVMEAAWEHDKTGESDLVTLMWLLTFPIMFEVTERFMTQGMEGACGDPTCPAHGADPAGEPMPAMSTGTGMYL